MQELNGPAAILEVFEENAERDRRLVRVAARRAGTSPPPAPPRHLDQRVQHDTRNSGGQPKVLASSGRRPAPSCPGSGARPAAAAHLLGRRVSVPSPTAQVDGLVAASSRTHLTEYCKQDAVQ